MPQQISLPGLGAAPSPPSDRLFFAVFLSIDAATSAGELAWGLRREHDLKGRPLAVERLHVTLQHLGDHSGLPPDIVAAAGEAAVTVSARPFDVAFDRVVSFSGRPHNRPLVLRGGAGLDELMVFQRTLGLAMTKTGLGRHSGSNFTPHVTLLYDGQRIAEQAVQTISWTVREFVLVHSLLGQTRHIALGRWPLGD
jgi:2'-5' RNA ligase